MWRSLTEARERLRLEKVGRVPPTAGLPPVSYEAKGEVTKNNPALKEEIHPFVTQDNRIREELLVGNERE